MNLKSVIHAEAASVFLNTSEFAEFISIEDVPETPAICDWSTEPGGEHLYGNPGETPGINAVHADITLAEGVIPLPVPGQKLKLNGHFWIVCSASSQDGLFTLKLHRNAA